MNKYYELKPISDQPKEDGRYFVINDGGYKDMLTYENGGWIDCDMYSGDWLITDPPKFYLAPLAEPVAVWVNGFKRKPVDPGHYDEPLKFVVRIKGDDPRSGWVYVGHATVEEIEKEKWDDYWEWLDDSSTPSAREAELEREVERYKEILRGQSYSVWKGCNTDLKFDEWQKKFFHSYQL